MTKYKFKIDTPWGKKGDELKNNNIDMGVAMGFWGIQSFKVLDPSSYPELFEEIIETFEEIIKENEKKWIEIIYNLAKKDFLNRETLLKLLKLLNADAEYNEICGGKKNENQINN